MRGLITKCSGMVSGMFGNVSGMFRYFMPLLVHITGTATKCAAPILLIPTRRNNPRRDSLRLRSAGIIRRFGAFYSLALGLSMSLTIRRPRMGFAMLKDCWNNPQIWGLLSPTWSRQDGTKSLPISSHPLSPIYRPPSFPKVSHHDSHHRHRSYF